MTTTSAETPTLPAASSASAVSVTWPLEMVVESQSIVRRLPSRGPITFGRGLEIALTCDESAFEATGVYLFGAVMEEFLARYVSLNSFTETVLRTTDRGEVMRWPARIGRRHRV